MGQLRSPSFGKKGSSMVLPYFIGSGRESGLQKGFFRGSFDNFKFTASTNTVLKESSEEIIVHSLQKVPQQLVLGITWIQKYQTLCSKKVL